VKKQQIKHDAMLDLFIRANSLTKERTQKVIGAATRQQNRPAHTQTWTSKIRAVLGLKIARNY
jgi:hypothetical protein